MHLYTVSIAHKITKFLVRTKKINAENNLGSLIIQAFYTKDREIDDLFFKLLKIIQCILRSSCQHSPEYA